METERSQIEFIDEKYRQHEQDCLQLPSHPDAQEKV